MDTKTASTDKPQHLPASDDKSPPWFRWLPLVGAAMLLVAFLLPVPVTELKHRLEFNFRPMVDRETLWFAGQWAKLGGWGKFGYIAMPILGLAFIIGLYVRNALWGHTLTVGASVLGLAVAAVCIVPNVGAGGMMLHLSAWFVLIVGVTFGCVVASSHGGLAEDVARPYRWLALVGAAFSIVLAFAPVFQVGDGPTTLVGHVFNGFGVGSAITADALQTMAEPASGQSTGRNLGLANALMWGALILLALAGSVAIFKGRTFQRWQKTALPTFLLLIGALLVLFVGSCLWVQGAVDDKMLELRQQLSGKDDLTLNDAVILHRLPEYEALHGRLRDLIWIGVKSWLAIWGLALVIGTSLGRAVEDREKIRQRLGGLVAWALGRSDSAPSATKAESRIAGLESELSAIASMQAKGLISAEDGERLRSKLIADTVADEKKPAVEPLPTSAGVRAPALAASEPPEGPADALNVAQSAAKSRGAEESTTAPKPASVGDNPFVAALACLAVAALGLLAIWGFNRLSLETVLSNDAPLTEETSSPPLLADWRSGRPTAERQFLGHTDRVVSAVFSPDGRHVLTASFDRSARIWDLDTGKELQSFVHEAGVNSAVFSPDGRFVLTATSDGKVNFWDTQTYARTVERLDTFPLRQAGAFMASYSPIGDRVVAVTYHYARVWSRQGATVLLMQLSGEPDGLRSAVYSPDGSQILSAGFGQRARLWDAATGKESHAFMHDGGVQCAVFSRDGERVLTACSQGYIRVWQADSGQIARQISAGAFVYSASFSPDGACVVAALADNTVGFWDSATGAALHVLRLDESVLSVRFSDHGRYLLTAGYGGKAVLWKTQ